MDKETSMTSSERKRKKARQRRKMIFSISLIAVGLVLVITAVILEANHYPWGLLFGTATQDADSIPDPSPIELDLEDQGILITDRIRGTDDTGAAADPTEASEASAEETPPPAGTELPGDAEDTAKAPAVSKFVILGTVKIPVLKVSQNLLEGSGKQMKYGVGHVTSTAAPGQKGNCAVSGHRTYPFRYLDQLRQGDNIIIKAGGVTYTYAVYESFEVLPNEVWVLNSVPGEDYVLTVITCTPYMVSSHRLIVRARLIEVDGKAPQEYYGEISPEASVPPENTAEPGIPPTEAAAPTETPIPAEAQVPTETPVNASAVPTDAVTEPAPAVSEN
jgi:sortase A